MIMYHFDVAMSQNGDTSGFQGRGDAARVRTPPAVAFLIREGGMFDKRCINQSLSSSQIGHDEKSSKYSHG